MFFFYNKNREKYIVKQSGKQNTILNLYYFQGRRRMERGELRVRFV